MQILYYAQGINFDSHIELCVHSSLENSLFLLKWNTGSKKGDRLFNLFGKIAAQLGGEIWYISSLYRVKEDLHITCFLLKRTTKTLIMKATACKYACAGDVAASR